MVKTFVLFFFSPVGFKGDLSLLEGFIFPPDEKANGGKWVWGSQGFGGAQEAHA